MVIYARSEANRKVQTDKPSNQNLKRKQRGTAELETGGRQLEVAPVTRNSEAEKGTAGRLSTDTGREAWKQAEQKGKATGTKETVAHRGAHCEGETGSGEKKKQRPSSEMLKRKRTKGIGSQALIPEGKPEREAPVEQLWERSWEGRKETNRKPSTQNRKDGMGNQAGSKGKDLGSESGTEAPKKPAVRRKREARGKEEQIG